VIADLGIEADVREVAEVPSRVELTTLVNNAGEVQYLPTIKQLAVNANGLLHVKAKLCVTTGGTGVYV
jgi:short-subunit dehydrogenase